MPHRGAGQYFVAHSRPYQGNHLTWRVFHLSGGGAGARTDPALDTGLDMLTAGGSGNLINKAGHRLYTNIYRYSEQGSRKAVSCRKDCGHG